MKKIVVAIVAIALISIALFLGIHYLSGAGDESESTNPGNSMDTTSNSEPVTSETEEAPEAESSDNQLGPGVRGESIDWIYNGSDSIIEPEGSMFVLKSASYEQGETIPDNAPLNLGFNGTFNVTVNHSQIFDSPITAGLDWNQMPISEENYTAKLTSPAFLLVDITLENVDASQDSSTPYEFSASMFDLKIEKDFLPENNANPDYYSKSDSDVLGQFYFSQSIVADDPTAQDYYTFKLEPGNTMNIQLGFFVERTLCTDQKMVLKLGAISDNFLGILLNPIE